MSYTNQTQHYGLPQYVGTDVPAWLTDVNGAFATIDQGMNAAKTQADSAATAAGQAANDIVSINSTLGVQAGQISAAASAAAAAQTTANSADSKADTNTQSINGLDTRVTALESGSGGLSFKEINANTSSVGTDVPIDVPEGYMVIAFEQTLTNGRVIVGGVADTEYSSIIRSAQGEWTLTARNSAAANCPTYILCMKIPTATP